MYNKVAYNDKIICKLSSAIVLLSRWSEQMKLANQSAESCSCEKIHPMSTRGHKLTKTKQNDFENCLITN